jgi:hypothetical protein
MGVAYAVVTNSDRIEGRGCPVVLGYYAKSEDARAAAKGQGVWCRDASVETIVIQDSYEDKEAAKKRALAKLTEEDKRALGL